MIPNDTIIIGASIVLLVANDCWLILAVSIINSLMGAASVALFCFLFLIYFLPRVPFFSAIRFLFSDSIVLGIGCSQLRICQLFEGI